MMWGQVGDRLLDFLHNVRWTAPSSSGLVLSAAEPHEVDM